MPYIYAYKTPDGVRHEATLEAASREAVFEALRAQGIKPIKVVASDGSKANGEVRGVRRRIVALAVVLSALAAVGISFFAFNLLPTTNYQSPTTRHQAPRHQIYGDPALVEEFEHGRTEAYLPQRGDRLLAWFAQPGKLACPKEGLGYAVPPGARVSLLMLSTNDVAALDAARLSLIIITEKDSREVVELKQIVNGLHAELNAYLANGNGTIRSYWRRLHERAQQEMQIYSRTERELKDEPDPAVWEQKNDALRRLGLRTIVNPKDAE